MTYRAKDNHRPCACGAELEDECGRCASGNPLGSMRIVCAGCPFVGCPDCAYQGSDVVRIERVSCDNGGSKTAPGVASTNTGSLAQPSAAKPPRLDVST